MKDKRQRMAIAWPYAAVYTDPAFAASLLQAAASTLPLHYPPPPPMYTHHYPTRYHPYPGFGVPTVNSSLPIQQTVGINPALSSGIPQPIPHTHVPQGVNLSLSFDFPSAYQHHHSKMSPHSPEVHSEISLSPPVDHGLLIPATKLSPQTHVPKEPKLFKPYRSEL